jgi:hypothetical protein
MNTYILQENVLTDDLLLLPEDGKVFKGQYIAKVKQNKFQNAWQDKEKVYNFRSQQQLDKFLKKHYPTFEF